MDSPTKPPASIFIVGCGYVGLRVARLWQKQGLTVTGLARSEHSAEAMRGRGIIPVCADLDHPASLQSKLALTNAVVYYFAPPPKTGLEDPRMVHFLKAIDMSTPPQKLIYLSTSGVYGNQQGALVDESTPPNPQEERAKRRYHAEQAVRSWGREKQIPVVVLRVGGIYGPNKLPIARLKKGVPIIHEHLAASTNRIHADDLAQACVAAALRGKEGAIYNISDGCHSNMTEYFNTIADFLGLPRPPTVDWAHAEKLLSPGMLSYLKESRRLNNRRMLEELGVTLRYPDLKSGLAACVDKTNADAG